MRPVRDHGQERALEGLARAVPSREIGDHLVDPELAPDRIDGVDRAVGPGVADPHAGLGRDRFLTREHAEDALREALESGAIELVGAAEVVDHLGNGAALLRVPDVLGELVVLDHRAVRVLAPRGAQIHA